MTEIIIYSKDYCPYCVKAKKLFEIKGKEYKEIDITHDPETAIKMVEMAGGRKTVPQIFIGGKHIGGCDDLYALNDKGELDKLLA
jgi:glutaredoxin 3